MSKTTWIPPKALAEIKATLAAAPDGNKEGFLSIAEHMGNFSGVFATGASRATSVRERLNSAGEFGLASLKLDMNRTFRDIAGSIEAMGGLVERKSALSNRLVKAVEWGYSLEQEAILPPIMDQIKVKSGEALELQSLGSILDNLLHQTRPLIVEMVSGCQQAHSLISHLNRRIMAELESSQQGLARLRKNAQAILKSMAQQVSEISRACLAMENRSQQVNTLLAELVQAMQYDDITSQRIGHAISALEQVEIKTATTKDQAHAQRWAVLAIRIILDQLDETSADLVSAMQTIQHQLTRISDQAVAQAQEIQGLRGVGLNFRQEVAEITHHLNASLRMGIFDDALPSEVLRAVSQAENGIFQAKRALSAMVLSANRMENLASSLRHRGNDRMQILTGAILDLSRRMLREKDAIQGELNASSSILQSVSSDFTERVMPALLRTNALLRRMPLSIQQVDNHNTDNLAALGETLADAQSTVIQIMLLSAEMTFHITFQKNVQKVMESLQGILTSHGDAQSMGMSTQLASLAEEFQDLAALYTMESERRVHQQALHLDTLEEAGPAVEEDDGFELF